MLGIITTVTSLALIALVELGRPILERQAGASVRRDALRAGYYTVLHSFVTQTIIVVIVVIVGVVLAAVGFVIGRRTRSAPPPPPSPRPAMIETANG